MLTRPPPRLPTDLGHLCRGREDGTPGPQPQRGLTPSLEDLNSRLVPIKSTPQHPSLPRALPTGPASPRQAEPPPELREPSLPLPHPIPTKPLCQSGRGQAAGPLACGSGLSFGASFPGTRLGLSNLGALQGHSFPISASPALFWLKDSQDQQGPGTRWPHPYHDPWRVWPVWPQTWERSRVWGERGWGEIRDLRSARLEPTSPQPPPCVLLQRPRPPATPTPASQLENRFRRQRKQSPAGARPSGPLSAPTWPVLPTSPEKHQKRGCSQPPLNIHTNRPHLGARNSVWPSNTLPPQAQPFTVYKAYWCSLLPGTPFASPCWAVKGPGRPHGATRL